MRHRTTKETRATFAPTMVRAVLAREKTETRRLTSLEEVNKSPDLWHLVSLIGNIATFDNSAGRLLKIKLPFFDRKHLAVCEAFRMEKRFDTFTAKQVDHGVFTLPSKYGKFIDLQFYFDADNKPLPEWAGKPRHASQMPVRFRRIELVTVGASLQRLHEINAHSVQAEGTLFWARENKVQFNVSDTRSLFFQMWDLFNPSVLAINNPWVVVVKFLPHGEGEI